MLTRHSGLIIFFCVRSATPIGAGCIGAPIVLAEYKVDDCVRCASPIFKPIAYLLSFTNRKRKYVGGKTTGSLKIKQTSITTVRYNILTVARLPTPLVFRYPLPLNIIDSLCLVCIAYWRRGTLVRQYIGARMPQIVRIRSPKPCPIEGQFKKEADRTFRSASPIFIPIAY